MEKMIIAEIGSVHDGSFGNACKLIELASSIGADAVKFQTHIAEAETTANAPSPTYFTDEDRFAYFTRTSFSVHEWHKLAECANVNNINFISSPFSEDAVDILEKLDMKLYKIPSGEVTNIRLLEKISALNKPVLLSTGMSNYSEIDKAVEVLRNEAQLTIMQCTSLYPCPEEYVGLNVINEYKIKYPDLNIGFSDHTSGIAAGCAAASFGANIIEKHLTFSKKMYGSDAKNALEPDQFRSYAENIKGIWNMLSKPVNKDDLTNFQGMKKVFQKSIVYKNRLPANHMITIDDITFKKPGTGICASQYVRFLGSVLKAPVNNDQLMSEEDFQ